LGTLFGAPLPWDGGVANLKKHAPNYAYYHIKFGCLGVCRGSQKILGTLGPDPFGRVRGDLETCFSTIPYHANLTMPILVILGQTVRA